MAKLDNIPVNCEFPQLREILDAHKRAQTIGRYLGPFSAQRDMDIENCAIDQLHYKHKRKAYCRIVFTVNLRHRRSNKISHQIYFGNLFYSRKAQEIFASTDLQSLAQPDFGPAAMYITEWAMVLWAYPNLPGLPLMLDADKVLAMMTRAPEKFGLHRPPKAISATMTKYVPGNAVALSIVRSEIFGKRMAHRRFMARLIPTIEAKKPS